MSKVVSGLISGEDLPGLQSPSCPHMAFPLCAPSDVSFSSYKSYQSKVLLYDLI